MKFPAIKVTKWSADVSGGHVTITIGLFVLTIGLGWGGSK